MVGRRGFLGGLLAAPVAAKNAVAEIGAQAGLNAGVLGAVGSAAVGVPQAMKQSFITKIFYRAQFLRDIKRDAQHITIDRMPPRFGGKKSWSDEFKAHAYRQYLEDRDDTPWWNAETDEERVALLMKTGFGHLLKK